ETGGWIGHPRVSPKGNLIAFLDHPNQGDDSGSLAIVDLKRNKRILSGEWFTVQGLAWSPDGSEIWFTASKSGTDRTLYAITLDGKERMVLRLPGALMLLDISKDGRVLLMRASWRRELIGVRTADTNERELSWLDYSYPADLSADGKTLLFDEEGGGGSLDYSKSGGLSYAVYIRKTDGSPAVLLGEGGAVSLSPDGKWVVAQSQASPSQLKLLTTGAGEAKGLSSDSKSLYLYQPGELPARVDHLDLQTGKRALWKELIPSDPAGVETIGPILMTPDAKTCIFGYHRMLADLYLVEGLK